MRATAAHELLELIDTWDKARTGSESVITIRSSKSGSPSRFWVAQERAVQLLFEVERFVETAERSEMYAPLLEALRRYVFFPELRWQDGIAPFDPHAKGTLFVLGQLMTQSPPSTLVLTSAQIDGLQQSVKECLEILDSESIGDDEGLEYLREVLASLQQLLDGEDVDFDTAREAAYAAVGVAAVHARDLPTEVRDTLAKKLVSLVVPFTVATGAGASGNLLSTVVVGLLGP